MGEAVRFTANGRDAEGYLARPRSGAGPGVVVIQEWWGLVPHIKDVADRLANEGYLALAPDLFHGARTTEPTEAQRLLQQLDFPRAVKDMSGAVGHLLAHEARRGDAVGSVGFCMGGALSLLLATARPELKACVTFYGIPDQADYAKLQGAVLGHFAEHDDFASSAAVERLRKTLSGLAKPFEFHTYPGTEHAFFNDARPEVYEKDAAQLAWRRTLQFLEAQLR
ncbi:MAG: dienelactone hydrolase family protein [Thermoleophilaceae bacterium]